MLLDRALEAFRAVLEAMGESSVRACPALGNGLQEQLERFSEQMVSTAPPSAAEEMGRLAPGQLRHWAAQVEQYSKGRTAEVKELMMVLASTAESVGERDQRYAARFSELTSNLQTTASLDDLSQMRASVLKNAGVMRNCIEQMTREVQAAVLGLQAQVHNYRARLVEAEELAWRDPLTNLVNRRQVEGEIDRRIAAGGCFSVVMLDLDGFKEVNDRYGHLAGDGLLQQFAGELRASSRSDDVVGRWGGDEFVLVLDCALTGALERVGPMRSWLLGDYEISTERGGRTVRVSAALGVAEWKAGEGRDDIMRRADQAMYDQKSCAKPSAGAKSPVHNAAAL